MSEAGSPRVVDASAAAQTGSTKVPKLLLAIGSAICASGYAAYEAAPALYRGAAVMTGLFGAAIAIAGLVGLLFALAMSRSFDWFLAWRYLRRQNRSWTTFVVGVILLLVAGGLAIDRRRPNQEPDCRARRGMPVAQRRRRTGRTASFPTSGSRMMFEKNPEAALFGLPGLTQIVGRRMPIPSKMPLRV